MNRRECLKLAAAAVAAPLLPAAPAPVMAQRAAVFFDRLVLPVVSAPWPPLSGLIVVGDSTVGGKLIPR